RLGMLVICRRSSEPRIPQVRSEKRNFLRWHGRKNSPLDVMVVNDSGGVKNVALDIDYHHNILISHQKVNPKEAIIGW
ncbi:hypothetical protein Dimus_028600, partial [Dionaea muscipula]